MAHGKRARKPEATGEEPRFSLSYELDSSIVDRSADLLAGDRMKNPGNIAAFVLLIVMILVSLFMLSNGQRGIVSNVICLALVVGVMVCWAIGARWREIQLKRLRKAGLDTALLAKDARRREVNVFEDRVVLRQQDGTEQVHTLSGLRKPWVGTELLLLGFGDGSFLPIPRKAMSLSRFEALCAFVTERAGGAHR